MADSKEDWKRKDEGDEEEDEEVDESVYPPIPTLPSPI